MVSASTPGVVSLPVLSWKGRLFFQMPLARSLPLRPVVFGWRLDHAEGAAGAGVHAQDACLKDELVVEDAGVLEPTPERSDRRAGDQGLRIGPQRNVKRRLALCHDQ
jgi:hypothetical protein